jgi:hypothetical protein
MACLGPEAVNVDTQTIERTFPALIEEAVVLEMGGQDHA